MSVCTYTVSLSITCWTVFVRQKAIFGYVTWTNVSFLLFSSFLSFINCLHWRRESMICWSENFTLYSNADGIDFTDISGFDIFGHKINLYSKYTPLMVFGQSLYQFPMIWAHKFLYGLNWIVLNPYLNKYLLV